jgi:hypothetical protein
MKTTITNFNKYLIDNLPYSYPSQISLGQPLDYENLDEYIQISWRSGTQDESLHANRQSADCHIECFTRKPNVYAHFEMANTVLDILKHLITLPNTSVRVGDVRVNLMELEGNIKKADILFTIYEDEVI